MPQNVVCTAALPVEIVSTIFSFGHEEELSEDLSVTFRVLFPSQLYTKYVLSRVPSFTDCLEIDASRWSWRHLRQEKPGISVISPSRPASS